MVCKNCKRAIDDDSIFCKWCGERQIRERRKKGEVKVPKPRQLASGKWFAQVMVDGTRVPVSGDTEAEYRAKAAAIKTGLLEAKKSPKVKTLSSAIDDYIAGKKAVLSPETVRGYRVVQRNRFPELMQMDIHKITSKDVQNAINEASKSLSPKTVKNAWGVIHPILKASGIDIRLPQMIHAERPYLDPAQIKTFCAAVSGTDIEIPALLALLSLRRSEIFGLDWSDIDLGNDVIHVRQTMVYDEDGKKVIKQTTKNVTSRRDVPILIDQLHAALKKSRSDGRVMNMAPNTLYRKINRACEKSNLPLVGIHGLRHSFASLAAHLGIPENVAMRIGGWANDATMKRIYVHVLESDRERYGGEMAAFYNNGDKMQIETR